MIVVDTAFAHSRHQNPGNVSAIGAGQAQTAPSVSPVLTESFASLLAGAFGIAAATAYVKGRGRGPRTNLGVFVGLLSFSKMIRANATSALDTVRAKSLVHSRANASAT